MRNANNYVKENQDVIINALDMLISEAYNAGVKDLFHTLSAYEHIKSKDLDASWDKVCTIIESGEQDEEDPIIDADYYGFDKTGVLAIDRLLSTVACAIMALADEENSNERGRSPIQRIQDAANEAAKIIIDK